MGVGSEGLGADCRPSRSAIRARELIVDGVEGPPPAPYYAQGMWMGPPGIQGCLSAD